MGHKSLVSKALMTSKDSEEPAHQLSLTRTFTAHIYLEGLYIKAEVKINSSSPTRFAASYKSDFIHACMCRKYLKPSPQRDVF